MLKRKAKTHQDDGKQHLLAGKALRTNGILEYNFLYDSVLPLWHLESDRPSIAFFISIFYQFDDKLHNSTPL
ncbi:hypothetical protein VII00023_18724 [Vibrio ichthyoenteri ATCC 700023]|uniref:Uncharacterized protein n=2 Tax=Vibrio TaxID=662 RepID=A0A0C2JL03_9VIBR|nr:hypothetical protein VII00023_18724 [Vibrio ichthyoenteri ATCC 700023]KII78674.1 hypothetical protein OJ16_09455 [Vibrio renipiscarius]KII82441.1 hypothetical protein PL18_00855 [Vibrio renipiscarius]